MKIIPLNYLYFLSIITAAFSCSPKVITVDNSQKADIEFGIGNKAIVFAENTRKQNTGVMYDLHKNASDSIYSLFHGATNDLFVGRTNAQTFVLRLRKNHGSQMHYN